MAEMPASSEARLFLSTSTLANCTVADVEASAIATNTGPIILHGGHHVAVKSMILYLGSERVRRRRSLRSGRRSFGARGGAGGRGGHYLSALPTNVLKSAWVSRWPTDMLKRWREGRL